MLSICMLAMLSTKEYAGLLLVAGLVSTRIVEGKVQVETSELSQWKPFLMEYKLGYSDEVEGGSNVAEHTRTKVRLAGFKKKKKKRPSYERQLIC